MDSYCVCVSVSVLGCICQLIGPMFSCHLHSTGCFCPEVLSPVSQRLLWPVRYFLLHPAVRSLEASWLKREIEKEIFFINILDLNWIKSPAVFEWLGVASGWAFFAAVETGFILLCFAPGLKRVNKRDEIVPIAMKISFTFMAVFADVSMKSRLLSSAYACAS